MNRRQFVISFSALLANHAFASVLKNKGLSQTGSHVCSIQVEFLKNQSLSQFKKDREKWMDFEDFERIVADFEKQKIIVKKIRNIQEKSISISYYFSDRKSHDRFVSTINNADTVGEVRMEELGYRFHRQYFKA